MNASNFVAPAIAGLGVMLIASFTFNVFGDTTPEYAELVPAPDGAVWRVGEERTVWLDTNVTSVDLRVDSIDVGLGNIKQRESGIVDTLGQSTGCLDAVVSSISAGDTGSDGRAAIDFTIDRGSIPSGTALTLYIRITDYDEDGTHDPPTEYTPDLTSTTHNLPGLIVTTGHRVVVEASMDRHYPATITRTLTFTAGVAGEPTSLHTEEEYHMAAGSGIGLIGCHEHEDVLVTLHRDDGEELARYLVDVLTASTAAGPPTFSPPNLTRRVCVDAGSPRADIFDGGEDVGAAVSATPTSGLTYTLSGQDYAFFDVDDSTGHLTISDIGAGDTLGIDGLRLYSVQVTATDASGRTDTATVAVLADLDEISTGDGSCS